MVLMIWFELCIVFSMLHVCAIPGVNKGCAAKLEHTSFNVNWLVSLFWLILLFMIAAGVIDADYAPNFLLNYECMKAEGYSEAVERSQAEKGGLPDPDYRMRPQGHEGNFQTGFADRGHRGYRGANAL